MVSPGQLTLAADVIAVVQTLANGKANLPHRPFTVDTFHAEPNDRGGFVLGNIYNAHDRVDWLGYSFVCNGINITAPPLDTITRNPNPGWRQPWQSCYQRLRDALRVACEDVTTGIELWEQSISGPWPCQFPSIYYNHIEFYYPDTGQQERVMIGGFMPKQLNGIPALVHGTFTAAQTLLPWGPATGTGPFALGAKTPQLASGDPATTYIITAATGPASLPENEGQFNFEYAAEAQFEIAIGGTKPTTLDVVFQVIVTAHRGVIIRDDPNDPNFESVTPDGGDPSGLVTVDTSKFLPGATFTPSFPGWAGVSPNSDLDRNVQSGNILLNCVVKGTFEPGIYSLKVTSTADPNNRASGQLIYTDNNTSVSGFNQWQHDSFVDISNLMTITGTCGLIATETFEVPGIHDTKRVLKIPAPPFNPETDIPTGLWCGETWYKQSNPPVGFPNDPFIGGIPGGFIPEGGNPNPFVFVKKSFINEFGLTVTASTAGQWFAVTPPVRSLGLVPWDKMPWNIFPVTLVGSFGNAVPNGYLGYTLPYFFGALTTGNSAQRAYVGDGPAWLAQSVAGELNPLPKRWKPRVHYPSSFTIMDSNGNLQISDREGRSSISEPAWPSGEGQTVTEPDSSLPPHPTDLGVRWKLKKVLKKPVAIKRNTAYTLGQTLYDDNGNRQTITVAGTTAVATPAWNIASLGFTVDGTATWKLTNFGALQPAVARLTSPTYPVFWKNPVAGQVDPPPVLTNSPVDNAGNRPFDFKPQGWWIYRVAINRIPQTKTADKPPAAAIAVTIGCIRNGAFVAFGTYNTGTVINAYWPIFTNTALCYTASERVDIQAAILTCGNGYGTWGHVDFPFAATYLNDVEILLNKIQ